MEITRIPEEELARLAPFHQHGRVEPVVRTYALRELGQKMEHGAQEGVLDRR